MKKKPHVMRSPRTLGDVFAVEFIPGLWGYCRVIRATAIEIPAIYTRVVGMPDFDWSSSQIERWRVFFLTVGTDPGPPIVRVGHAPFAHDSEADMLSTYRDPDAVEPRYTIEEGGMYRYTSNPDDLRGIAKQVTLLPPTLGSFLKEKYVNGALREVRVFRAAGAFDPAELRSGSRSPLRKLPFKGKDNGTVFAVRIAPGRWGFVRFRDNARFGVLPVYSTAAGLPKMNWSDGTEKWFGCELSGPEKYETEDYVFVGKKPLVDPRAGFPDMYQPPQHPWQPWVVYRGNAVVHVNGPEDVVGMQVHRFMDAGEVRQLVQKKFDAGELVKVEVSELGTACETIPGDKQIESEAPTIVFAKIVQAIHPAQRERDYEEPLAEFLAEHDLGEVTGGGTMQDRDGSVLFAGIDIEVRDVKRAVPLIAGKLAELGAPEGSELEYYLGDEQFVEPIPTTRGKRKRGGAHP